MARCLVMKPQTYMNRSGEAVREAAQFYKIPPDRVLVIYDDVSLPAGKLRVRPSGSAGGHNGIKNMPSSTRRRSSPASGRVINVSSRCFMTNPFIIQLKSFMARCGSGPAAPPEGTTGSRTSSPTWGPRIS